MSLFWPHESSDDLASSLSMVVSKLQREACLAKPFGMDIARRLLHTESELLVFDSIQQAEIALDACGIVDIMLGNAKNEPVQEASLKTVASMLEAEAQSVGSIRTRVIGNVKRQLAEKRETCYLILETMVYYKTNVAIQTHGLAILMTYPCWTFGNDDNIMSVHIATVMVLATGFAQRILLEAVWISTNELGLDCFMEKHDAWTTMQGRFRRVVDHLLAAADQQLNDSRDDDDDDETEEVVDMDDISSVTSTETIILLDFEDEDASN